MSVDLLDYGAFGALVLVLGAVGLFLRNWLKGEQERQAKREERQAEREKQDREERQNLAATLTHLGESSVASSVKLQVVLDDLCTEMHSNQDSVVVALSELIEGQRAHEQRANEREKRASERHSQVMEMGREITQSLKTLNGRS